jgi:cytochrome b
LIAPHDAMTERIAVVEAAGPVRVWDLPVRIFHWLLVALIAWSLASGFLLPPTWIASHLVAGTAAIALVVGRLVWGFLGPTYARFGSFLLAPRAVLAHVAGWRTGAHRYLGHNPLGGLMVMALLLAVAALAVTGVVVLGGSLKTGPLAFAVSFAGGEDFRRIHELLAWLLLVLITLHVGGVTFESRRSRENLVRSMIDGRKPRRPGDVMPALRPAHVKAALAIGLVVLLAAAAAIVGLSRRPGLGVPASPLDPLYVAECGACHTPFHPSLAPAAAWTAVMETLADHFGEDASLDPETASSLRAYLVANAAERFDTRPAHEFRLRDPADPLRITATPFWRSRHAHIPDNVFAAGAVGARTNCAACHRDAASGFFYPGAILIPEAAAP